VRATTRLAVRRFWTAGRLTALFVNPVIDETADTVTLWQPIGLRFWRALDSERRTQHLSPFGVLQDDAVFSSATWSGQNAIITLAYTDPFCVYTFWSEQGEFQSFFGNIQLPTSVTQLNENVLLLDSTDLAVDVIFHGFHSYEWRDIDELEERAEHEGYWKRTDIPKYIDWGEQLISRWTEHKWPFPLNTDPPATSPSWQNLDLPPDSWLDPNIGKPPLGY